MLTTRTASEPRQRDTYTGDCPCGFSFAVAALAPGIVQTISCAGCGRTLEIDWRPGDGGSAALMTAGVQP